MYANKQRKHRQKTNNNNNVLLRIHIRHKKCTESLLNGDYSVKLSDRGRRKIDSKEASSLSQESLLTSISLGARCALGRLRRTQWAQRVLCFLRDSSAWREGKKAKCKLSSRWMCFTSAFMLMLWQRIKTLNKKCFPWPTDFTISLTYPNVAQMISTNQDSLFFFESLFSQTEKKSFPFPFFYFFSSTGYDPNGDYIYTKGQHYGAEEWILKADEQSTDGRRAVVLFANFGKKYLAIRNGELTGVAGYSEDCVWILD